MDNQEAKFILRAYRPGGADASDPTFIGALEQARQDPELAHWFGREQMFDRVVAQKLRSAAPPGGLRQAILAGGRVSRAPATGWGRGSWIGLAASILLLFGLGVGWKQLQQRGEVANLSSLVMADTLHGRHGSVGEPAGRLAAFLSDPSVRLVSTTMPIDLDKLRATGCRSLSLAGHEILEVCFLRAGKDYHLYVMSRLEQMPRLPQIKEGAEGAAAAAWSDEHHSYVLATVNGTAALRSLL